MSVLKKNKESHLKKTMFFDEGVDIQRFDVLKYPALDKITEKQFKKVLTLILKDDVLSKKMSDKIKSLAKPDASLNIIKNINMILNGD